MKPGWSRWTEESRFARLTCPSCGSRDQGLVTVHQNNCPRLLDRARDAHSLKSKSGLSPLQHVIYFLASPFSEISLFSYQIFLHTFAAFFIMLFHPSGMFDGDTSTFGDVIFSYSLVLVAERSEPMFWLWEVFPFSFAVRTPGILEAKHAQKMPKAFSFDQSTVHRVKHLQRLAKENQSSTPTKEEIDHILAKCQSS
ncbi:hypothetical protein NE237_027500 [Protea cynaroides]|uniref:Uncharacterized protein n=1 Tax=Protea cynaroides TaxID=273540 RepID=A0A9Q0GN42_9MAGN|nr:hypothetical protein NE237_027500 [Protea cynaroides]